MAPVVTKMLYKVLKIYRDKSDRIPVFSQLALWKGGAQISDSSGKHHTCSASRVSEEKWDTQAERGRSHGDAGTAVVTKGFIGKQM